MASSRQKPDSESCGCSSSLQVYRRALAIAPACVDLWVQYCEAAGFSDEVNEEHQFAIVCIWMHVARRLQSTFPSNDRLAQGAQFRIQCHPDQISDPSASPEKNEANLEKGRQEVSSKIRMDTGHEYSFNVRLTCLKNRQL
eukprot:s5979_g8.t1